MEVDPRRITQTAPWTTMRGAAIRLKQTAALVGALPPTCTIVESAHACARSSLTTGTHYLVVESAGKVPEQLAAFLASNVHALEDATLFISGIPEYFLWEWRIASGTFTRRVIATEEAHVGLHLFDHHPEHRELALDLLAAGLDDRSLDVHAPEARERRALDILTTQRPHAWEPWLELGYARADGSDPEGAERAFARAFELAPEDDKPWCTVGMIEVLAKIDGPRALACARRSKLAADSYWQLGRLEHEHGAPALARAAFLAFLRSFDRRMGQRLLQIAKLRELQGDPHAAEWRHAALLVDESLASR